MQISGKSQCISLLKRFFDPLNTIAHHVYLLKHCDIKPDNWIICTHPEFVSDVMLVDFGRAKELKILADGISVQTMRGQVATEGLECVAMRANDTWSFDVDTYTNLPLNVVSVCLLVFSLSLESSSCVKSTAFLASSANRSVKDRSPTISIFASQDRFAFRH